MSAFYLKALEEITESWHYFCHYQIAVTWHKLRSRLLFTFWPCSLWLHFLKDDPTHGTIWNYLVYVISTRQWLWMDIPFTVGALSWTTGPEGSKLPWKTVSQLFALSPSVVSVFLLNRKDNFKLSRGYNVCSSVVQLATYGLWLHC